MNAIREPAVALNYILTAPEIQYFLAQAGTALFIGTS